MNRRDIFKCFSALPLLLIPRKQEEKTLTLKFNLWNYIYDITRPRYKGQVYMIEVWENRVYYMVWWISDVDNRCRTVCIKEEDARLWRNK